MKYKLSFNNVAVKQLFTRDHEVNGLRVRVENGILELKPVEDSDGRDVIVLTDRKRGGKEAVVEGKSVEELFAALPEKPYFSLFPTQYNWIRTRALDAEQSPHLYAAMRVWGISEKIPKVKSDDGTERPRTSTPTRLELVLKEGHCPMCNGDVHEGQTLYNVGKVLQRHEPDEPILLAAFIKEAEQKRVRRTKAQMAAFRESQERQQKIDAGAKEAREALGITEE